MSEICTDKIQCGTLEQSVSPCGAGYTGSVQCEVERLPQVGSVGLITSVGLAVVVVVVYRYAKRLVVRRRIKQLAGGVKSWTR